MEQTFMIIGLIDGSEVVHITDEVHKTTLFYGKVLNAYAELDENTLKSKKVMRIYNGFGGLCITTVDCE